MKPGDVIILFAKFYLNFTWNVHAAVLRIDQLWILHYRNLSNIDENSQRNKTHSHLVFLNVQLNMRLLFKQLVQINRNVTYLLVGNLILFLTGICFAFGNHWYALIATYQNLKFAPHTVVIKVLSFLPCVLNIFQTYD